MAVVAVAQRASQHVASGTSVAISVSGLTPGNFLVVVGMLAANATASSFGTVTDNGVGSAWQNDVAVARASGNVALLVASTKIGSTPPTTITVPWSASTTAGAFKVYEFSGVAASAWKDVAGSVTTLAANTTASTGTITPTAGDLIIAAFGVAAAQSGFTAGAGYTSWGTPTNTAADICAEYKLNGTTSESNGGTFAAAATTAGRGVIISYKAAPVVTIVAPAASFSAQAVAPNLSGSVVLAWNEDFEPPATVGSSMPNGSSNASIDTVLANTGTQSFKVAGDPGYGYKVLPSSGVIVLRFYCRINNALPSQGIEIATIGNFRLGYDQASGKFGCIFGTAQTFPILSNVTIALNQWYRFDFRLNATANPHLLDWKIDGVDQPQGSNAAAAATFTDHYLGHTTGFTGFLQANYDSVGMSYTAADYPLIPHIDNFIAAPPATFTGSSVAPVLGIDDTNVAPPAIFTGSAVAPLPRVDDIVVAPPATWSASAVASALTVDESNVAPPAILTASAVAPVLLLPVSNTVVAPAATFTASSVAPALQTAVSATAMAPPATFTASSVAPIPNLLLSPVAATWTATAVAPGLGRLVLPNASLVTFSAVAPAVTFTDTVVAPSAVSTYTAVSGALSLGGSVAPAVALTTFSAVAPQIQVSVSLATAVAITTYTAVAPGLGRTQVAPAGYWTATAASPSISWTALIVSPAGTFNATGVGPVIQSGAGFTLASPASIFTATGVAPTLFVGTSFTLSPTACSWTATSIAPGLGGGVIAPAGILTASGVGPFIFLHSFYPTTPAVVTLAATAPGILAGSGTLVVAPAATASYAASAPVIQAAISSTVTVPPALLTLSAPTPSPGIGKTVSVPAGITTFSTVAPSFVTGTVVGAPAAAWQAIGSPPSVAMRLDAPAGFVSFDASAPVVGSFLFVIAPIAHVTFRSVPPLPIGSSVGTEFTYTPGSVWQSSLTSGDVLQPQTGRIVQTYERF